MYAIVRTGGKQYKVHPGDTIRVEKLEAQVGSEIVLKDILLVGGDTLQIGAPAVVGAEVAAIVLKQDKYPKVIIFKKKRRQGYRRIKGHRQTFTELFIKSVAHGDNKVVAEIPAAKTASAPVEVETEVSTSAKVAKKTVTKKVATKKAPVAKKAPAKKAATKKTTTRKSTKA